MKRARDDTMVYDNRPFKRVRGATYRGPVVNTSRPVYMQAGYRRYGYGYYGKNRGPKAELKYFDTALSFTIDATGEVPATGQLALIPQGDTSTTRDGRQAQIKSIHINAGVSYIPAAGATASGMSYIYLVLDKQCNGAAAAATDVLTSATFAGAMFNLDNSDRFVILKKWIHAWNPPAGTTTAYNNQSRQINYYRKCNIPMTWSSTAGAITEIRSNNLFLLAGSTAALDDLVAVGGTCRLRFQG